jgi:hypothetical protein
MWERNERSSGSPGSRPRKKIAVRIQNSRVIIGLAVVAALLLVPAAVALAQDHPETFDTPHPTGVPETEFGAAATACEVPTGGPQIASGDLTAAAPTGSVSTVPVVASEVAADPRAEFDAPHPTGVTETPHGATATACGQPSE